jgi:MoxR-like ATPase
MYTFEQYKSHENRSPEQLANEKYLASAQLATAVNTALAAEQPLLVMGESGTGKTKLAQSIADQLGLELVAFHTRSDHQAKDLLYHFDHIRRFYDAQVKGGVDDLRTYVKFRALGEAIEKQQRCVVLIDEIDKAPRDLPNDLLDIIESKRFTVDEMNKEHTTKEPPIVVITSNNERQLPEPFLRRCVFHHIKFPDKQQLARILQTHFGDRLSAGLAEVAIARFEDLRARQLEKPPATSELIKWCWVLVRAGVPEAKLKVPLAELPHLGALLKTQQDHASIQA